MDRTLKAALRAALSVCLVATGLFAEEAADPSAQSANRVTPVSTTHTVGGDGAFTYGVPIKVPSFHGLEPGLALSYNSQSLTRSGAEAFLAVGWQLAGLSTIELRSAGGGAPTFDPSLDIYVMDGVELLACKDAAATNAFADAYPAQYSTTVASASCSAGGNMASLRENHLKIVRAGGPYDSNAAKFYVYRGDGTRLMYQSAGSVAGLSGLSGDEYKAAFRAKWVLTEIQDVQSAANTVTISYSVADKWSGFAPRVSRVSYGGYHVKFYYESNVQPVPGYATGTDFIGRQNYRMKSIEVMDGATQIRAYQMEYANSQQTGANLLTKVREYGSNYVRSGSVITSGSQLPAFTFTYGRDQTFWGKTAYTGNFHTSLAIADSNDDGRDDLLFYNYTHKYNGATRYTLPTKQHQFNANKVQTAANDPHLPDLSADYNSTTTVVLPLGITQRDISTGHLYALTWTKSGTSSLNSQSLKSYRVGDSTNAVITSVPVDGACVESTEPVQALLGNFDTDAESEVVFGNRVYNVNDGKIQQDTARRGVLGTYLCGGNAFPDNGTAVADIDGDGFDEIIGKDAMLDVRGGVFTRVAISNSPFASVQAKWVIRFGDVNGDGAADAVIHDRNGTDRIGVALSTGKGFQSVDWTWDDGIISEVDYKDSDFGAPRQVVADVNGDGLADIVLHNGYSTASVSPSSNTPLDTLGSRVYLSNGKTFIKQSGASWTYIPGLLGTGDFNGDGVLDLVFEDEFNNNAPAILYNGTEVPNLMTAVTDQLGGTTLVEYSPSTQFADNDIPGVQQLVTKITRQNGFSGYDRVTLYSYTGSKYDYANRKSLGFATVTAELPRIDGETVRPQQVTTYENAHWGVYGRVKSSTLIYNGVTQKQTINDWARSGSADRPLSSSQTRVREKTLWGSLLLETDKSLTQDLYGQPTLIVDKGFGGTAGAGKDDVTTAFSYRRNLDKFIVNKPEWKIVANGTTATYADPSNWISAQYYSYDGSGDFWATPGRGNLTKIEVWTGTGNTGRRTAGKMGYDSFGNVAWQEEALGRRTTHVYDARGLFLTQSTNPLGHVASTVWNTACQAPTSGTDVNALVTGYVYDVFCRQTRVDLPHGQKIWTSYNSIGNAAAQYVKQRTQSASADTGRLYSEERSYFNGFGQTYRTTKSGEDDDINDAVVTLRAFDGRGNLGWESLPQTWAFAGTRLYVGPEARTSFSYDVLGRMVKRTNADASYATLTYASNKFADRRTQNYDWPMVVSRDEQCFDASADTLCGYSEQIGDARGQTIRSVLRDEALTDVGAAGNIERKTDYTYDNLGRLVGVIDPIGATWAYSFDTFGNRVQTVDPALGTWTMEYDANGQIIRQVDAKGQPIEFSYDQLGRVVLKRVGSGDTRTDTRFYYDEVVSGYYNIGKLTNQYVWTLAGGISHRVYYNYHKNGQVQRAQHAVDGRNYYLYSSFRTNGMLKSVALPLNGNSQNSTWLADYQYDAANRMTGFGTYVTGATYNLWDAKLGETYGNGTMAENGYDDDRGFLLRANTRNSAGGLIDYVNYAWTDSGRIAYQRTLQNEGRLNYTYDYAGRLKSVVTAGNRPAYNQDFTYDRAGSMQSNSLLGTYAYNTRKHAPKSVTIGGVVNTLSYDANGNMLTGIRGKVMTYDGENRPVSVTCNGKTTRYEYGADGSRLKQIQNAGTAQETVTLYLPMVEIRNYGQGSAETNVTYPHSAVRLVNNVASYMHRDLQASVQMVSNGTGGYGERRIYRPFGDMASTDNDAALANESTGWLGERYDADAGLQYLNARYYDPELGLFTQPDWFEVTEAGVGTNRYAYAFNDPVNGIDPGGNASVWSDSDGDGLNETVTHFSPDSDIGRDLANGDWDSYWDYKDKWGSTRDDFSTLSGTKEATWTGHGFKGTTQYGDSLEIYRNSPDKVFVNGAMVAEGVGATSQLARLNPTGLAIGAAVAAAEALGRARWNITYVATGPGGQVYIGRASGYLSTPQDILNRRWSSHHMTARGFGNPQIDQAITGDYYSANHMAIRGREQQLIDSYGGVGSPAVANSIRGVAANNPLGRTFHNLSDARFGNIAPYTGN